MAIETKTINTVQAYQKLSELNTGNANAENKRLQDKAAPDGLAEKTSAEVTKMTIRNEQQASLIQHLFGDPSTAPSDALKMTFQAAMEKINEILGAEMPATENAPISEETLQKQGGMEYWTPQNTANRIVAGATAFLSGYQAAHPELEGEALMNSFLEVVGGGISQGFEDAKGILGDLKVLQGSIADNIDTTYKLVQDGLLKFRNQYLGIETASQAESPVVAPDPTTETKNSTLSATQNP